MFQRSTDSHLPHIIIKETTIYLAKCVVQDTASIHSVTEPYFQRVQRNVAAQTLLMTSISKESFSRAIRRNIEQ